MSDNDFSCGDDEDDDDVYTAVKIVDQKQEGGRTLFLVRWKNYSEADDTWEPRKNILDKKLIKEFEDRRKGTPSAAGASAFAKLFRASPNSSDHTALPNKSDLTPAEVVATRMVKGGSFQYLVRWIGHDKETWEPPSGQSDRLSELITHFLHRRQEEASGVAVSSTPGPAAGPSGPAAGPSGRAAGPPGDIARARLTWEGAALLEASPEKLPAQSIEESFIEPLDDVPMDPIPPAASAEALADYSSRRSSGRQSERPGAFWARGGVDYTASFQTERSGSSGQAQAEAQVGAQAQAEAEAEAEAELAMAEAAAAQAQAEADAAEAEAAAAVAEAEAKAAAERAVREAARHAAEAQAVAERHVARKGEERTDQPCSPKKPAAAEQQAARAAVGAAAEKEAERERAAARDAAEAKAMADRKAAAELDVARKADEKAADDKAAAEGRAASATKAGANGRAAHGSGSGSGGALSSWIDRLPPSWRLGVILGPTASGKTRAIGELRTAGLLEPQRGDEPWPVDRAVVSAIADSDLVHAAAAAAAAALPHPRPGTPRT